MFGRKKMYKKGLADAMQAYEAFGKKQEDALAYMREEVRSGNKKLESALSDLGEEITGIYDHLTSQEKASLYHLSTPMDIKDLEATEKKLLMAVLVQLATDEGDAITEGQRGYIRSIQRYLEITDSPTEADLSAVENIDSIDVQKAFLQVALEFFYLQDSDELSDAQEAFLGYFSVNRKQAALVEDRVSRLFNAVGAQGMAEKYGYVPVEEPKVAEETASPENSLSIQKNSKWVSPQDLLVDKTIDLVASMGIDNVFETENYIFIVFFGHDGGVRMDKRNSKIERFLKSPFGWRDVSNFTNTIGDKYYFISKDTLYEFDLSAWTAPQRKFRIGGDESVTDFSVCDNVAAFITYSKLFLYHMDTGVCERIATKAESFSGSAVLAVPQGIYYSCNLDFQSYALCFYEYATQKSRVLFLTKEALYRIYHVGANQVAYVATYRGGLMDGIDKLGKIEFGQLKSDQYANIEKYDVSSDGLFCDYRYQDRLLYVTARGRIESITFEPDTVIGAAPGAVFAMATKVNGAHRVINASERANEAIEIAQNAKAVTRLYRIGNWICYGENNDDSLRCKVSLDNPGKIIYCSSMDVLERLSFFNEPSKFSEIRSYK